MAYSLCVSGAQAFLPSFYRRLFESDSVALAGRAGRQRMLSELERAMLGKPPAILINGDPLSMRVILSILDKQRAASVTEALQSGMNAMVARQDEPNDRLQNTLGFSKTEAPLSMKFIRRSRDSSAQGRGTASRRKSFMSNGEPFTCLFDFHDLYVFSNSH